MTEVATAKVRGKKRCFPYGHLIHPNTFDSSCWGAVALTSQAFCETQIL